MFDAFFGFGDAARDEFIGVGVVGEVDPHLASFVDFEVVFLVEDRPGVTRTKQWVKLDNSAELLDMPGVLWPKFEDQSAAVRLAFTGAISDDILDIETLAMKLLSFLSENYPDSLVQRYKVELSDEDTGLDLLEKVGRKRGMMISGGEINTERAAITVLDEFRSGKLGRITLELPPQKEQ